MRCILPSTYGYGSTTPAFPPARFRRALQAGLLALLCLAPCAAAAEGAEAEAATERDRVGALEEKVDILAAELSKALTAEGVPEEAELEGVWGLAPAASKVYKRDRGLSIGGYGEIRFQGYVSDDANGTPNNVFDTLRAIVYVGYKFNDRILVNSETEFEHGSTDEGGSVSTEFLNLDFMLLDDHGARAGLLLVPMGFINEIHEPTFFFGAERPEVERTIIPSTWRENGAGVFGRIADRVSYRVYAINGMRASGFSASGLRGGRQKGAKALANHWAVVARVDVDVMAGLLLGGSVYTGLSGQDEVVSRCTAGCGTMSETFTSFEIPDTHTTIYEVHAQYVGHGMRLRALFTHALLDDAGKLNAALAKSATSSIAKGMIGVYGEAGYDVLPHFLPDTKASLEPFFRYERLDTQFKMPLNASRNGANVKDIYTVGLHFKPIPQVVIKLDYRNIRPTSGQAADQIQAGVGYVF